MLKGFSCMCLAMTSDCEKISSESASEHCLQRKYSSFRLYIFSNSNKSGSPRQQYLGEVEFGIRLQVQSLSGWPSSFWCNSYQSYCSYYLKHLPKKAAKLESLFGATCGQLCCMTLRLVYWEVAYQPLPAVTMQGDHSEQNLWPLPFCQTHIHPDATLWTNILLWTNKSI